MWRNAGRVGVWLFMLVSVVSMCPGGANAQDMEWVRQFGGALSRNASAQAVDADGCLFVAGRVEGTLPGQTSSGSLDAFVRKYDADGNEVWTRQFGTSSIDTPRGISVHATGVYVAGETRGTLPGQTASGSSDAFVRKYDADGNEVWTRQFGSSSSDFARGISADATGVYVAGETQGTLPGQTSSGILDVFVRKYAANGEEVFTLQFGTPTSDSAAGIAVDLNEVNIDIYVTGSTFGEFPGQTSSGSNDVFLAKFRIQDPIALIPALAGLVTDLGLDGGTENSLHAKLDSALNPLDDENLKNDGAAVNSLEAFINEVEAQSGVHIPEADALDLIAFAEDIIALLGG